MSWNRPNVLLCGTLQKWRNVEGCLKQQLAGVKAARMLITAGWVSYFCVCVYIYLYIYIKEPLCYGIFFLLLCSHIPLQNHLSFFLLLTWILFLFRNRKKNPEHLCLLPICYTSARYVAGLQSSVSNPRMPFIFLLKCLTAVANAHALEGFPLFFFLHYWI